MEFRVSIPTVEKTKSFLAKAGVIGLIYFITAYLGTFIIPYIDAISFFELPAIALAGAIVVRYGWTGILGCVVGSLLFHLLKMPWQLAAILAIGSGISAFIFNYLLRLLRPSVVTINQVSTVAAFAFVAAPIASAVHTVISILSMQWLGFTFWDSIAQTMMAWWFSELLLSYLTVPLLLSIFAFQKIYFEIHEKLEMATAFVAMVIVSWLILAYGHMLASSEIIIFVLLAFVLLAALRFKTIVTHAAIFMAALIAFATLIFNVDHINSELYSNAVFTLKIGLIPMALGGLFVASAFTERHNAEAELNKLANHDPLTSLPNRTYFQHFLTHSLAQASRQKQQVYLLFIDLDRFKKINDSEGHELGDAVLRLIATRLNEILRADDFVARLGGDEFAVVYTHPPINNAASNLARKIIGIISESFELQGRRYSVGASIGISVYPNDATDAHALLRHADLAMYQAKSKRSGFEYFSEEMNVYAHEQLAIENGLRQALEKGELLLMYQPKVDLRTNQVVGLEALVRWLTNAGVLTSPDKFIPIAEETGLIVPIGRFVIREACEQWVRWYEAGLNPPPVAVNISPRQFSDLSLISDILEIIKTTRMNPAMLNVEITESATMDDPEMTMEILAEMRALNLHLYIDDFGTGHSNLGQLRRLPIDAVKIDKSFINDVLTNNDDAEIVTAIINLAHALKIRVVSEGIETKAQLAFLRELGCDEIQGFLVSKPVSHSQVETFFNKTIKL
ncbi:EAL domain-containing protein [Methylotenera sp.]|uniref:putative bifunctional diguanylate cyclase/phosphodiesterase n=1 Tax=Methylotenera sp. TaxID=2051956 RepID=UPI00248A7314|nr:EAL domain-containing protein [Methylotenera sp.]MDI1299367.1 EAL domain-containing protein [Methylotenera sp.]